MFCCKLKVSFFLYFFFFCYKWSYSQHFYVTAQRYETHAENSKVVLRFYFWRMQRYYNNDLRLINVTLLYQHKHTVNMSAGEAAFGHFCLASYSFLAHIIVYSAEECWTIRNVCLFQKAWKRQALCFNIKVGCIRRTSEIWLHVVRATLTPNI